MAKKTLTVTLYKSELTYDILNKTDLTGRSRFAGSNHEEVANMIANEDDENMNQIRRSIGSAFAALKTKLSEYVVDESTSSNDILDTGASNLVVTLTMPSNYNSATRDTISSAMHQYIVNTAIGDWFTITNKSDAGDYVALAQTNIETIREAINKRVRPVRSNPA